MKSFLYNIASIFHHTYGNELYKQTFVFPNRRAGVFFQKFLSDIVPTPIFSPNIITIQELFNSLTNLEIPEKIDLLVIFYDKYISVGGSEETLDEFLFWGEMLLNDFSDIDKYMVNADQLFLNIHNLKEMDDYLAYLSKEQIDAIRQFWSNFGIRDGSETKKNFMETWEILLELYHSFKEELASRNIAYEGMLFRDVAERAKRKENLTLIYDNLVFVGLNALTPSESALLEHLNNKGVADFYWDYDSPLVNDRRNKASFWIKDNLSKFPSKLDMPKYLSDLDNKKVTLVGVPSGVGQAKIVNQLLSNLIKDDKISKPNAGLNTAIVLPDENLLLPVLYSIPKEIEKINVTMGYSLQHSSIASLINTISSMQHNIKRSNEKESLIYYKFVLAIIEHPLVYDISGNKIDKLKGHIQNNNRVMLSIEELGNDELLKLIFTPIQDWKLVSEYLKQILSAIFKNLSKQRDNDNNLKEEQEAEESNTRATDIELEFIVQYYKSINRLQDSLSTVKTITLETYFRLLKQLAQSLSISFTGEPLSGLQVMGILETRVIDFENLIILSMNEGMFPLKKPTNSFIPYSLRRAFDLPTFEHQDSTYAYHFYRMISRAKNIFMLYDTRTEDMQTGEVSRYFYQMKYLYRDVFDIKEVMVNYDVSAPKETPVSIPKTDKIMAKMQKYLIGGESALSASSINNYINCPLQFYLSAVEGLAEEDEVQESIEADVFGTIYHTVIQNIYDRHKDQKVLPDTINAILNDSKYLNDLIELAFAEHYFKQKGKQQPLAGYHYLIGEILKDYIKQTLQFDKKYTPFKYIDSEHKFNITHSASKEITVNIRGSIDRIDKFDNKIRLIDYKTGGGRLDFTEIDNMFDRTKKGNRRPHILQVFIYALAYNSALPISPSIYYLRSIFNENFDPRIIQNKLPIDNIQPFMDSFTEKLNEVIKEIFDPLVPFSQTEDENICKWCTFKEVCRR